MFNLNSKPILKPSLYSGVQKDGTLIIGVTPQDAIEISELDSFQTDLILLLDGGLTVQEIVDTLVGKGHKIGTDDVLDFLNQLGEYNILEDNLVYLHDEILNSETKIRFDRQLLLFSAVCKNGYKDAVTVQKKLADSHITLIGIGGVGSYIFYALAAMGIGKLTVVDYDHVEISNLSRQILYTEKDTGRPKLEVAKERGNVINSKVNYTFIDKEIKCSKDFEDVISGADLVILAADTSRGKINYWMDEAAHNLNIPFLHVGSTQTIALCGPIIIPGETPRWKDTFPEHMSDNHPVTQFINDRYKPAIIDPYNATAASIAALEAVKFLTNFSSCQLINRRWFMDLCTLETHFQEINYPQTNMHTYRQTEV
ncbi:HesA/MoeB/ThiF family protein [Bacillus wiedmannii]|uniref:HesA/MoeB/ThiF family protein n=1 Tax=Bacillus wiedmannii TaxID=1890302 RepID=UPI003F8DB714